MSKTAVLVLYNQPVLAKDHRDAESEHSVIEVAAEMARTLEAAGFRVAEFGLGADPARLLRELKKRKPDVVFNLFEGNPDHPETESYVAGLLDWSGIPYTGSPPEALSLARAKHKTKHLLKGAGLPTADFLIVNQLPMPASPLKFPVIVKPAGQDGSVGVDQSSVCLDRRHLSARVEHILATYGPPVMVEEYIDGRELNIPLVELPELQPMPPLEIAFPKNHPDDWPILTYDGKWKTGHEAPIRRPVDLSRRVVRELGDLAMKAYRLIGCRDYARVDFRMNASGKIFILEVNPNPEISETAGLAGRIAKEIVTYPQFIVRLIRQAMSRQSVKR